MSDEKTMKTTPGRNRANLDNANYGDVNLDDYEAKYMPDAGKLTELIELCRGENRPKQDFATLIKVNPPKYSRISQGKVKKQVEKDLLKRIYDHQIEPGRVGLDELLRAGGWRPIRKRREGPVERYEPTEEEKKQFDQEMINDENRKRAINSIVRYDLDIRRCYNSFFENRRFGRRELRNPAIIDQDIQNKSEFGLRYPFFSGGGGFTLTLQEEQEFRYWCFFATESLLMSGKKRDCSEYTQEDFDRWRDRLLIGVMNDGFNTIFLKDAWEPEKLKNIKSTMIFHDPMEFDLVWSVLGKKEVNNWFSLLLIDLDEGKVVEERILPRKDGKKMESLFERPPIMEISDDETDPYEE